MTRRRHRAPYRFRIYTGLTCALAGVSGAASVQYHPRLTTVAYGVAVLILLACVLVVLRTDRVAEEDSAQWKREYVDRLHAALTPPAPDDGGPAASIVVVSYPLRSGEADGRDVRPGRP